MTTEVQTLAEEGADQAPPPITGTVAETPAEPPKPRKREPRPEVREASSIKAEPGSTSVSPELREVMTSNEKTIKSILEGFGSQSFRIRITRKQPDEVIDPATNKTVNVKGFLKEVDHEIDEGWLTNRFGGGVYELEFKKPGPKGGFVFGGHVTVPIAGEPLLSNLPRTQPAGAATAAAESPSTGIVKDVMSLMGKQLEKAEERAERANGGGGNDMVYTLLREQLAGANLRMEKMQEEMRNLVQNMNRPQPQSTESKVEEKLLSRMFDDESSRLSHLRALHEAELRTLKENQREDLKRVEDRCERDIKMYRESNEREISNLRTSHETSIASIKASSELQVATARSTFETQTSLVKAEIDRLTRENAELRAEVKELRARKDKSPIELLRDMKELKDAFTDDEDDKEETSTIGKIVEGITNPATLEGVSAMIGRLKGPDQVQAAAQQAQLAAQQAEDRKRRRVVRVGGKKMIMEADGKTFTPIEEKPVAVDAGPVWPEIDPGEIALIVKLLESAYEGGQSVEIVAQGARSRVPEALITAIRDHGVDQVLSKMAKLSSTSPLSSQRGRVWVRELGKALVGE